MYCSNEQQMLAQYCSVKSYLSLHSAPQSWGFLNSKSPKIGGFRGRVQGLYFLSEQYWMLASHRQSALESQLKSGRITVRDFIRGLAMSDSFRRLNYESNNNYRFAQMCVQRILGREVYGERESMSWSIVLATQGLQGFIDTQVNSEDYSNAFGDSVVPYQRRRILPQQAQGDLPFARMARYGDTHLEQFKALGHNFSATKSWPTRYIGLQPQTLRLIGAAITYGLGGFLLLLFVGGILSWFG